MSIIAERIGSEYRIYRDGVLVAACTDIESFLATARLLNKPDTADDGLEVDIINRVPAESYDF